MQEVGERIQQGLVVTGVAPLEVTEALEEGRHFLPDVTLYRDDVLRFRLSEVEGVEDTDPGQLLYGFRMVVYEPVVVTAVAAAFPYYEEGRRLLAPGVPSRLLARVQRRQQPPGEIVVARLVGARHSLDDLSPREDVALDGVVLTGQATGPVVAVLARKSSRASPGVHDPHLALSLLFVFLRQKLYGLTGGFPPGH